MRKPIFKTAERARAAKRFADHVRETFGLECSISKSETFPDVLIVSCAPAVTKYGPMKLCFDISPSFAHVYRQFNQKPGDDLPWRTALNPHSFKWNKWTTPHEHPAEFLDLLFADLEREHRAIVP